MDLALAWKAEDRLKCESCGHQMDDSMTGSPRDYEADELTCHACQVIEWRRTALSEQDRDMAGLRIYAKRRVHDGR